MGCDILSHYPGLQFSLSLQEMTWRQARRSWGQRWSLQESALRSRPRRLQHLIRIVSSRVTAAILDYKDEAGEPSGARALKLAVVLGLHVAALAWLAEMSPTLAPVPPVVPMNVRIIDVPPPAQPPRVEAPKPLPKPAEPLAQPKRPVVRPAPAPKAPPVLAARPDSTPTTTPFAVPPQPAPTPRQEAPATQVTAPVAPAPSLVATPARFDADYLQNPAPAYPPVSKRLHEEGTVHLLVRVSANGSAERVQVKQSSGSLRLDEAAVKTVQQWRFIPARMGNEAVAASVVVPIVFRLDS